MFKTEYNSSTKTWCGQNAPKIYNKNVSMGRVLMQVLQKNINRVGQISADTGIVLTNGEIRIKAIRAAQNLKLRGFQMHDIFTVIAKNSHHLASIVIAGLALGTPIQTMDTSFTADDILYMIKKTHPKAIFCDADIIENVRKAVDGLETDVSVFVFNGPVEGATQIEELFKETGIEETFIAPELTDGTTHPAIIVCTSGTTGRAKGVCLSHATLLNEQSKMSQLGCEQRLLSFSSLHWLSGYHVLIAGILASAIRIITTEKFTPELFLNLIEKYEITYMLGPPSQLAMAIKSKNIKTANLSSLQMYACGGSAVSPVLCEEMNTCLPNGRVIVGYGMSEVGGFVTFSHHHSKLGSVGQLIEGLEVKLINESDGLVGPNEEGEICIRMPYPMIGYYGDESATRTAIDDDGFVHSGDIGYFNDDGFLHIIDRKKEIFKYLNFHISPSEIEEVIQQLPYVKSVCVTSVPDLIVSDLPAALVVTTDGTQVTEKMIFDHVASIMPDCKKLRGGVYFVDSFPLTPSGKIIKRTVKEMAISLFNKRKNFA